MSDEQIIEDICKTDLWKSPWYWVSDFLIDYYVTICLATTALVFTLKTGVAYYFFAILALSIIYDILWKKNRLTIRGNKSKFVRIFVTLKFDEIDESTFFSTVQRAYLILMFLLQSVILFYENLYGELAFTILMGAIILVFEYLVIRTDSRFLARMEFSTFYNMYDDEHYAKYYEKLSDRISVVADGGYGSSSHLVYTKFLPAIFILFFYFVFFMCLVVLTKPMIEETHSIPDVLIAISVAIAVLFAVLYVLFFSSIANRAREVAKLYLKISKGGNHARSK